jgi:hypothetical protein
MLLPKGVKEDDPDLSGIEIRIFNAEPVEGRQPKLLPPLSLSPSPFLFSVA